MGIRMLLASLLLIIQISLISGSCTANRGEIETDGGARRVVCEYRGVRMLAGSAWKTADCEDCTCDVTGLSCCKFGEEAGIQKDHEPNNECVERHVFCDSYLVKASDPTLDCFSGRPYYFLHSSETD
ncbi:hypothetical protein ScPMuIL_011594 [Solemya velum]